MTHAQADLKARVLEVHETLCEHYGAPFPFFRDVDPLSELVGSMLSHRTRNEDSGRALVSLKTRFRRWEAVRDAPTEEVQGGDLSGDLAGAESAAYPGGLAHDYRERCGELSLEFLAEMEPSEAQAWLEAINGVGPKTSAAVLLFSRLHMPALPVDSHHHRVAQRLGFIPQSVGPGPAHKRLRALLPEDWPAQTLYDHHEALMYHGQRCCFYRRPACGRCPVLLLCPYGQEVAQ